MEERPDRANPLYKLFTPPPTLFQKHTPLFAQGGKLLQPGKINRDGEQVLRRHVVQLTCDAPPLFVLHRKEATREAEQVLFEVFALGDITRRNKYAPTAFDVHQLYR